MNEEADTVMKETIAVMEMGMETVAVSTRDGSLVCYQACSAVPNVN